MRPHFWKFFASSAGFQASTTCPFDKISIGLKICIEHKWNDTDLLYWSTRKNYPFGTLFNTNPTRIGGERPTTYCLSHGTATDWPSEPWHSRRLTALAMAQPPTYCPNHGTAADWLPEPRHNPDWLPEPWHNRRLNAWAMAQPQNHCLSHGTILCLYNISFFPVPKTDLLQSTQNVKFVPSSL